MSIDGTTASQPSSDESELLLFFHLNWILFFALFAQNPIVGCRMADNDIFLRWVIGTLRRPMPPLTILSSPELCHGDLLPGKPKDKPSKSESFKFLLLTRSENCE